MMRDVHACDDHDWQDPFCGAVVHWDCRNSGAKRFCGADHYSKVDGRRNGWFHTHV